MNARRVSRELILMVLSQIKLNETKIDIEDILVNSVRTLINDAKDDLETTTSLLIDVKDYIQNYEIDSAENKNRPVRSNNVGVDLPKTDEFNQKIDNMLDVAEKCFKAIEAAEMAVLEEAPLVKDYAKTVIENIIANKKEIDGLIEEYSIGWDISRMVSVDRSILRMSICELLYNTKDVPQKVIIDEAIELAKRYSTEDSSSFINGVLGKVISTKLKK
ncbi:MAG: transcription antitermination factor NusB [Candidatus Gastranaerophilales bacterium]|nr:transcription antitermination factor NusB [Candidatus Gastranaerophilales bacterium]